MLGVVSPGAREASRVSIAGGHLTQARWARAQAALLAIDRARPPGLPPAARPHNRAHATPRRGAGGAAVARRRYRMLGVVSPGAREASRVSIAGCHLIEARWDRAQAALLAIDGARLPGLLRAAWLNNRAYAIARGGAGDAAQP